MWYGGRWFVWDVGMVFCVVVGVCYGCDMCDVSGYVYEDLCVWFGFGWCMVLW